MFRFLASMILAAQLVGGSATAPSPANSYVLRFHPPVGKTFHYKVRLTFDVTPQITITIDFKTAMEATGYNDGACTLTTAFSDAQCGGFPDNANAQDAARKLEAAVNSVQATESVAKTGKVLATKLSGQADGPVKDGMAGMLGQLFVPEAVVVGASWTTKFVDDGNPKEAHMKLVSVTGAAGFKIATLRVTASKKATGTTEEGEATVDLSTGILRSVTQTAQDQRGKETLRLQLVDK